MIQELFYGFTKKTTFIILKNMSKKKIRKDQIVFFSHLQETQFMVFFSFSFSNKCISTK